MIKFFKMIELRKSEPSILLKLN